MCMVFSEKNSPTVLHSRLTKPPLFEGHFSVLTRFKEGNRGLLKLWATFKEIKGCRPFLSLIVPMVCCEALENLDYSS
jgi:hypothetical protein